MGNNYKSGEILEYIGKGFIIFDPTDSRCMYIEPRGSYSSIIRYKGMDVLVYNNEINTAIIAAVIRNGKQKKK